MFRKKTPEILELPITIHLHTFRFLSAKEVKKSSRVSRFFKDTINTFITGEFYMVGNPVKIAGVKHSSALVSMKPLSSISEKEIRASFPTIGIIKLFPTESAAQQYARSGRRDPSDRIDDDFVFQPAVFKVQLLKKITPEWKTQTFLIPPFYGAIKTLPSTAPLTFFQVEVQHVAPVQQKLHIDFEDDGRIKRYGEPPQSKCLVM